MAHLGCPTPGQNARGRKDTPIDRTAPKDTCSTSSRSPAINTLHCPPQMAVRDPACCWLALCQVGGRPASLHHNNSPSEVYDIPHSLPENVWLHATGPSMADSGEGSSVLAMIPLAAKQETQAGLKVPQVLTLKTIAQMLNQASTAKKGNHWPLANWPFEPRHPPPLHTQENYGGQAGVMARGLGVWKKGQGSHLHSTPGRQGHRCCTLAAAHFSRIY